VKDDEPRENTMHKRIVEAIRIPGTRSGHWLRLECGHTVMAFGPLHHANGVVFCEQCLHDKAPA
jgi:hypothetical protein